MPHPPHDRHEDNLNIRDDRAEAGSDERDRLVPEVEIGREEQAAGKCQEMLATSASVTAPGGQRDDREDRNGVGRAIKGGGHRRDMREPDEDRRKRDAQDPEKGQEVNHDAAMDESTIIGRAVIVNHRTLAETETNSLQ